MNAYESAMDEYEARQEAARGPAGSGPARGAGASRERSPEEIEQEIEMIRERMSQDIDVLTRKLSPENLKRQAQRAITDKAHEVVDNVGEKARHTGNRLVGFIRDHPLQVAAIGLSAAWMFQRRKRSGITGDPLARSADTDPQQGASGLRQRSADRAAEVRQRVGEAASSLTERAAEMAGNARERVGDFGHGARLRISDLGSRARDRGRGGLEHAMEDYPLALAAGAAILGLGLGLLVPESERENRLMGPTRDDLVNRAQAAAERVKVAAVAATHEVREAVRDEAASRSPEVKSAIQGAMASVGAQLKDAAGRVQVEARQAAQDSIGGRRGGDPA